MKSGVSVVELLVGCVLLAVVVSIGAYSLRPVTMANKRYRITLKAQRLEDNIRRSIFYQSSYASGAFQLEVNGVILAKQGETRFVNESLTESVLESSPEYNAAEFPLVTKVEMVGDNLLYQIQNSDSRVGVAPLGTREWPPTPAYVASHLTTDHSIVKVPPELASSVMQTCQKGIMRGIEKTGSGVYTPVCWEYQEITTKPTWAIPTGYKLDGATNRIEIEFSKLNKPKCPEMRISNLAGDKSWELPNFYAFSVLDLRELFPTRAAGTLLSESKCERVIDFFKNDPAGLLPATVVLDATINNKPGVCPDKNLYLPNPDGSCRVNFRPQDIPDRKPAEVGL